MLSNERGQSLIGMIVSIGIASILMMMVIDLNTIMTKTNTTAQANSDIVGYVQTLRSNLQSSDSATRMLQGNLVTGPVTLNDPLITGQVLGRAGYKQQPQDAWSVQTLTFDVVPAGSGVSRLTLILNVAKDQTRVMGSAHTRKIVGDIYCALTGSTITTCSVFPPTPPPVVPTVIPEYELRAGCSSIGGTMSGGVCSIRSSGGR